MFSDLINTLKPLGYTVYDTDVPEQPEYPYIVVWGGHARPHLEQAVSGQIVGVDDLIRVTYAAALPEAARLAMSRARQLLQPGGFPSMIGGYMFKLTDHQPVQVDRDESIIGTNRHPSFAVDVFRVTK